MTVLSRIALFSRRHPIVRGMVSYAIIWPSSCLIQQTVAGKSWNNYDWGQITRFGLYGSLFVGPTLYGWIRISTIIWPQITVKTALTKAFVEQLTYGPAALACFYFSMGLLNNKTFDEAVDEVKTKFIPTFKVGFCFWPVVQTFNFLVIAERNRVPFVSACSLLWGCFLSYMDHVSHKKQELKAKNVLLNN
ncbi:hypothetical protein RN001_011818 [Aquatica leii]|uniref:Mpv17-like protein n=1 Tax=Aquatica leii TaxID=1421715 RepID=A0AAN7P4Y9_9COLE|nr:hypothetical protein RN001_011818 [Aquatica leii]